MLDPRSRGAAPLERSESENLLSVKMDNRVLTTRDDSKELLGLGLLALKALA